MQVAESEVKHVGEVIEVNTIVNQDKIFGAISDSSALFTMQVGSELNSSAWKEPGDQKSTALKKRIVKFLEFFEN